MRDTNLAIKATGALTQTTSGSFVDFGAPPARAIGFVMLVTAFSGTSLDVKIEEGTDGTNASGDHFDFGQVTATGEYHITARPNTRYLRYTATISGTSITFSIYPEFGGRDTKY